MLYGEVWLQIKGNQAAQPLDFVRRVLVAMSTEEGKVSQLAFQHEALVGPAGPMVPAVYSCDAARRYEPCNPPFCVTVQLCCIGCPTVVISVTDR